MIWSIFPFSEKIDAQISWESHLSGAISGLMMAVVLRKQGPQKPLMICEEDEEEEKEEKESGGDDYDYAILSFNGNHFIKP